MLYFTGWFLMTVLKQSWIVKNSNVKQDTYTLHTIHQVKSSCVEPLLWAKLNTAAQDI